MKENNIYKVWPRLSSSENPLAYRSHLSPSWGSEHRAWPPWVDILLPFIHILWTYEQFGDVFPRQQSPVPFWRNYLRVMDLTWVCYLWLLLFLQNPPFLENGISGQWEHIHHFSELSKACFPKSRTRVSSAWWSFSSLWPRMTQSFFSLGSWKLHNSHQVLCRQN